MNKHTCGLQEGTGCYLVVMQGACGYYYVWLCICTSVCMFGNWTFTNPRVAGMVQGSARWVNH